MEGNSGQGNAPKDGALLLVPWGGELTWGGVTGVTGFVAGEYAIHTVACMDGPRFLTSARGCGGIGTWARYANRAMISDECKGGHDRKFTSV